MEITNHSTAGTAYADPVIGSRQTVNIKLDVSTLTTDEVDAYGYLKPGTPIRNSSNVGVLVSSSGQVIYGIVTEPIKLPGRTDNTGLSSDTSDPIIAVATMCVANQDVIADNLGRAITADELAAFAAAGSHVQLTTT